MTFAKRVFFIAAILGVIVLAPQYFMEAKIGRDFPPPITHPEHFYGFVSVALAWQILFFVIARDPVRYRGAMIPAVLEKVGFGAAAVALYGQGRTAMPILVAGILDLIFAALFWVAWRATPDTSASSAAPAS